MEALNALVVGVSADKPEIQQRFIDKFELTFPMISDTTKTIIDAYGAREVLGVTAKRRTFLIDPNGKVARA
ncbi:MAG: redoxin domain-containing protein, partial [Coriobacteriia bacterium]|nr:redoxin domain-containing protein [Coriobacteriia bacterium]